ncbi:MAG: hypothetical protein ACKO37_03155 [Vampirovibrionales bacterium]
MSESPSRFHHHLQQALQTSSLSQNADPPSVSSWVPSIKVCGLTRLEDMVRVAKLGGTHWGTIMVPETPRHLDLKALRTLLEEVTHLDCREGSTWHHGMTWVLVVQLPKAFASLSASQDFNALYESVLVPWLNQVHDTLEMIASYRQQAPLWVQCHGLYECFLACQHQHALTFWQKIIEAFHHARKVSDKLIPWSLALSYVGETAPSKEWCRWHSWHQAFNHSSHPTPSLEAPFYIPQNLEPLRHDAFLPQAYILDLPKGLPLTLEETLPVLPSFLLPHAQRGCPIWLAGKLSPETLPQVFKALQGLPLPDGWDVASGVEYAKVTQARPLLTSAKSPERLEAWFQMLQPAMVHFLH